MLSAQQQRQNELHYFIFAARYHITNKPCDIDKSVIFSCAKNIPVILEWNCPTLSQTSSMKLVIKASYIFITLMTVLKEYCNMTSRFACGILALVYERDIPLV